MIPDANSQPSEKGVQKDADANRRPCCVPENADDSQMHGKKEAHFDRLELVANGNGWSGRERHTDLSHEITSNARLGIWPKPAVSYGMILCPVDFRHQGRRARETNPSLFCEAISSASKSIIPLCGQACT